MLQDGADAAAADRLIGKKTGERSDDDTDAENGDGKNGSAGSDAKLSGEMTVVAEAELLLRAIDAWETGQPGSVRSDFSSHFVAFGTHVRNSRRMLRS